VSTPAHTSMPRACTTAAAVRTQILEPAMELVAITARECVLLGDIAAARSVIDERAYELEQLFALREAHARAILGLADLAHQRLQYAESRASYDAVSEDSEGKGGRDIAARLRSAVDLLADSSRRREHDTARTVLHGEFESYGDAIFEQRVTYHLPQGHVLALRGEYAKWRARPVGPAA
jgi:hypothetical protein